jgi:SpoVK/Ycf46/Vps4 family AAA+-type ATPase
MESLQEDVRNVISASHPIVYFRTDEEIEVLKIISQEAVNYLLFSYDEIDGIRWLNEENFENERKLRLRIRNQLEGLKPNFSEALSFIQDISQSERTIFVILSADTFIKDENPQSQRYVRFLKNLVNRINYEGLLLSIFLVSDRLILPSLLEKDMLIFETDYPNRREIRKILDSFLEERSLSLSEVLKSEFVSALQGLTRSEIENLLFLAVSSNGVLDESDIEFFINYKRQIVKKNAIVEYIDLRKLSTEIGGMKNLKKWLEKKREIFKELDKAVSSGVDIPKGVLLFGMPGCGKSLAAKYTAKLLGLPLLRLDMGRIMGPYLGQSEENLRKAIKIAESIAPSVLWIDEVEKALAGVKGGNSDTVVRIFGTLLTWMQEKTKPVFVIATANDISGIPPEFLRKGRFDEIFFVDFPDKESIKEIFKIHLKKRKKGKFIDSIDFDRIVYEMREGYAGSDIEAIVSEVVERAFLGKKEEVTTEDILNVIKSGVIKPISETLEDKIEELRRTYKNISAQPAN